MSGLGLTAFKLVLTSSTQQCADRVWLPLQLVKCRAKKLTTEHYHSFQAKKIQAK